MMWLIIGMVLGLGLAYLVAGLRSGRLQVRWYQWILGLAAIVLLLLAVQNYFALLDELQPKMAGFALVAFGLPGLILAVLTVAIPRLFRKKGSAVVPASKIEPA